MNFGSQVRESLLGEIPNLILNDQKFDIKITRKRP